MTSKLSLSLNAPGLQIVRWLQTILFLVAVGFLSCSMWIVWETYALDEQIVELQQAITRTQMLDQQFVQEAQAQEGLNFSPARMSLLAQEVEFAKRLHTHQSFSWTIFLTELEAAVPDRISMESITLNFRDGTIALSGSAATLSDLQALVNGLDAHRSFADVVVASHKIKTPDEREPNAKPYVVFSLKVTYQSV